MGFIGVVLAGGQSRRMGCDKALLKLKGKDMLTRTVDCLTRAGAKQVIVSRNEPGNEIFSDIYPNKGPLSGIHTAAVNMAKDNLLLVPVDLPYLSYKEIQRLSQFGQAQQCSCYFSDHNLPLYLQNDTATIETLQHILLDSEDYSVAGFIRQIGAQAIEPVDTLHLLNTNTPLQWQQALQAVQTQTNSSYTEI
jgi:molybdopterin-guanine dinucleotide biosynthesis protein A